MHYFLHTILSAAPLKQLIRILSLHIILALFLKVIAFYLSYGRGNDKKYQEFDRS